VKTELFGNGQSRRVGVEQRLDRKHRRHD
jgi:hypothetical protein